MEVTLPSGFTVDADALPSLRTSQNVKRVETKNGDTVVVLYFDKVCRSLFQWKIEYVSFCRVMEKVLPSSIKVCYLIIYIVVYHHRDLSWNVEQLTRFSFLSCLFNSLNGSKIACLTLLSMIVSVQRKPSVAYGLQSSSPLSPFSTIFDDIRRELPTSKWILQFFSSGVLKQVTKKTTDFKGLWMHKDMMCNGMNSTADCSLNICVPRNKV